MKIYTKFQLKLSGYKSNISVVKLVLTKRIYI